MTELATTSNGHNRRTMLKRGLVLAAGAFGVTAAGKEAQAATRTVPNQLRLSGRNWRLSAPDRRPGEALRLGDVGAVYGDLFDGIKGSPFGQFFGARLAIQSAPGGHARADGSVEVHTFVLPHGTIVGMGTAVFGDAIFAIVGGTGKYHGVTGSYVAKPAAARAGRQRDRRVHYDRPAEDVTLNFAKILYEYDAPDGEVDRFSWDLVQNRIP